MDDVMAEKMLSQLELINARLGRMDARFETMDSQLGTIESRAKYLASKQFQDRLKSPIFRGVANGVVGGLIVFCTVGGPIVFWIISMLVPNSL